MKKTILLLQLCCFALSVFAQQDYPLETIIQRGHSKYVTCAAFSPDGKYIATGSYDNTIKIWNIQTGKQIRDLQRHTDRVRSVVFSKDGSQLLSAGKDNRVVVFEVISGKVIQELNISKESLFKAVYSPDEKFIIAIDNRNIVYLWDAVSGEAIRTTKKSFSYSIYPEFFSPASDKMLVFGNSKESFVISPASGDTILTLPFEKTHSMKFSPDGKYIALGSTKIFAKIYDAETGKELHRVKDDEDVRCDGCNMDVAFSHNSKYLVTGTRKMGLTLWDVSKGKKIKTYRPCEEKISHLKFSPDDNYLLSCDRKNIEVYNVNTGKLTLKIEGDVASYFEPCFASNSQWMLLPGEDNRTDLWDVTSGRKVKSFGGYMNKKRDDGLRFDYMSWVDVSILKYINAKHEVAISPDGRYLAKGGVDSIAILLDLYTGRTIQKFVGHSKVVLTCDFSSDGKTLITAGGDGTIFIWDVATGKELKRIYAHREVIFDVCYNADNTQVLSGAWDGSMRLWDVESRKNLQYIKLDGTSPYSVGFSPNDLYLVGGDLTKNVQFYETDAGDLFRNIIGHTDVVSGFAFSPDGKSILTGSWDGKAKLYDVLTGMLLNKFSEHSGSVLSVAFDPLGKFMVTGSADRTVIVRDMNGIIIKKLEQFSNGVSSIQVSKDGKFMVTCSVDGVVKLWDTGKWEELYTYIRISRDDWLVTNPAGYFDGSKKALELVNYVSGMEVVPIGSLFEKYYTPGLLQRIMQGEKFTSNNLNETIKTSPKVKLDIASADKRAINLVAESVFRSNAEIIPLNINVSKDGGKPEEIRIYNNGKLIISESFHQQVTFRGGAEGPSRTFDVNLTPGDNKLSVVVINDERTESAPAEIEVLYDKEAAKTDLYVLAIGINKYQNPAYTLKYAINDAKEYTQLIENGADSIFNKIELHFIKDKEANKENIVAKFNEMIEKVGPEDVFLFYYAGHGVMGDGENDEFYLVAVDVTQLYGDNDQLKSKAVSAEEIMEFSRKIAAQKQLFILDACQSGGALQAFAQRGASREKALAQLARSTGTFFLTASQDMQYANESNQLQHGLFTYAILEALRGKADGGTMDNKITVNELKTYVEDRVPELSEKYHGSPQYPTSYSYGQDFPLLLVK